MRLDAFKLSGKYSAFPEYKEAFLYEDVRQCAQLFKVDVKKIQTNQWLRYFVCKDAKKIEILMVAEYSDEEKKWKIIGKNE